MFGDKMKKRFIAKVINKNKKLKKYFLFFMFIFGIYISYKYLESKNIELKDVFYAFYKDNNVFIIKKDELLSLEIQS